MRDVPMIISTDDHVVEPPDLWTERLPQKFRETAPRTQPMKLRFVGGTKGREWVEDEENGQWCDAWRFEDATMPLVWFIAAIGLPEVDFAVARYEDLHEGCWKQGARLADMKANHISHAMQFPNIFRFAGQAFSERKDKELALACLRAYNDWVMDEWCGGDAKGILLPLTTVPLWDPVLAAQEVYRCAEKGSYLVTFPENPYWLGFNSLYSPKDYWAPFFRACEDTGSIVNMHIGSSSRMTETTPDSPFIVSSTQTYLNSQGSLLDFIFSGTFDRHPNLKVSYSEGQVGWLPYVMERADKLWEERSDNEFGSALPIPPSHYIADRVYFCMFDDATGLRNRDVIGMEQITFETDYPHPDSTFPNTRQTLAKIADEADLSDEELYGLARGNAIRGFGLERYGITE